MLSAFQTAFEKELSFTCASLGKDWYLEDEKTSDGRDCNAKLFEKLNQLKGETQDNSEENKMKFKMEEKS